MNGVEKSMTLHEAYGTDLNRDRHCRALRLGGPERATCREVRKIAVHHLEDIRAKINDLRKLEHLLAKTVAQCSGQIAPECPVLGMLDMQRFKRANV
jgi:hypothetical protein